MKLRTSEEAPPKQKSSPLFAYIVRETRQLLQRKHQDARYEIRHSSTIRNVWSLNGWRFLICPPGCILVYVEATVFIVEAHLTWPRYTVKEQDTI